MYGVCGERAGKGGVRERGGGDIRVCLVELNTLCTVCVERERGRGE